MQAERKGVGNAIVSHQLASTPRANGKKMAPNLRALGGLVHAIQHLAQHGARPANDPGSARSTAKTHIRRIYRKCDIHNQQDLMRMVEDAQPTE